MTKSQVVAVTGGTGFVGRRVVATLLDRGHQVRALVRDASASKLDSRATAVPGSLGDSAALDALVRGADAVVHLVGIIMEKPRLGQTFDAIHHRSTVALLDAARKAGVKRWVQMSALGVRPDALSDYHRTKWLGEQAVRASGVPWTILRPSLIHGPEGEFMQMVKGFWTKPFNPPLVVPDPSAGLSRLYMRQCVPYFGGGIFGNEPAGLLQPIYVDDVAACFVAALDRPGSIEETYGLGGPDFYTWRELYRTIQRLLPGALDKRILAIPAWYAKMMTSLPLVGGLLPFNRDQVVMSQEDATCNPAKAITDLGVAPRAFEPSFAEYAGKIA